MQHTKTLNDDESKDQGFTTTPQWTGASITNEPLNIVQGRHKYHAVREIMRVLGMPSDHPRFKELRDKDLRAFTLTVVEQRLGDSYPDLGDFSFVNTVKEGEMRTFLEASTYRPINLTVCPHCF